MEFRTTFSIEKQPEKISYETPVMLIGSCFASEIGSMMELGKMKVAVNPTGTLFNPFSAGKAIDDLVSGKLYGEKDLAHFNNRWFSFNHYTSFTADSPSSLLEKINSTNLAARTHLAESRYLFITFGTSVVYSLKESGEVVSNCHRLPANYFSNRMAGSAEIAEYWTGLHAKLVQFNPALKLIFTVSPVRHWKDGAHANQVSKAVLFLAVEKLLETIPGSVYFPAYELLMDDLRDYRFYSSDLLHPSAEAVEYIWERFAEAWIEPSAFALWKEARKITAAASHRFISDSALARKEFAEGMLKTIDKILSKNNGLDFSSEISYFQDLAAGA